MANTGWAAPRGQECAGEPWGLPSGQILGQGLEINGIIDLSDQLFVEFGSEIEPNGISPRAGYDQLPAPSWSVAVGREPRKWGGKLHENLMQYAYDASRYRKEIAAEWIERVDRQADWVDVLAGQA